MALTEVMKLSTHIFPLCGRTVATLNKANRTKHYRTQVFKPTEYFLPPFFLFASLHWIQCNGARSLAMCNNHIMRYLSRICAQVCASCVVNVHEGCAPSSFLKAVEPQVLQWLGCTVLYQQKLFFLLLLLVGKFNICTIHLG